MNVLARDWQIARAQAQATLARLFDESKHPRDQGGKFTETGGDGGDEPSAKEPKSEKPAKGISSQPSWPKEDNGTAGKGDEILVYRSESTYSRKFEGGTNAGNADGMAASFVQKDAPGMGDKIAAYRVRLTKDIAGKHTGQATGWERDKALEGVARDVNGDSVTYHFPATGEGYTVEKLGYVSPFPGLWKKLQEQGLQNPPEAGQAATADAIRAMFNDPGMVTAAEESEASEHSISHLKQPAVDYGRPFKDNKLAQEHYKNAEEYRVGGMSIASYKLASGKGDAYSVNRALRGKDQMTPEIQKYVDGLDLAFDRTAIPLVNDAGQPTAGWLYRGIRNHFDKYKVGQVVDDSGFVSTSVFKQFAEEWIAIGKDSMTGGDGTLVRITVPKGTKVVTIQNTQETDIADEGEVLLNRGTKFRVTKVNGKYIEMTVIP